ncbi:hypothetical protein F511_32720 [Dorcoceras hygrometricum]|uniref:Uncharacterized protein n=1 Tax=Dorcoceras hygrometricum TaxID=472368 RepID=A0A2Z7BL66_9LAMI|nr:hypothetical protein F511_32720 [Dorcoceras hygrometricum]
MKITAGQKGRLGRIIACGRVDHGATICATPCWPPAVTRDNQRPATRRSCVLQRRLAAQRRATLARAALLQRPAVSQHRLGQRRIARATKCGQHTSSPPDQTRPARFLFARHARPASPSLARPARNSRASCARAMGRRRARRLPGYGSFNPYIPIRSTTIGKSRVAIDPIAMHTSWRSNSDIDIHACLRAVNPRQRCIESYMHRGLTQSNALRPQPPPPLSNAAAAAASRLRRKFVSRQFDEENPFVLISSVLLVQAGEGVSFLVVDRIGDIYRSLPRRADVIVTTVGAGHKCQQEISSSHWPRRRRAWRRPIFTAARMSARDACALAAHWAHDAASLAARKMARCWPAAEARWPTMGDAWRHCCIDWSNAGRMVADGCVQFAHGVASRLARRRAWRGVARAAAVNFRGGGGRRSGESPAMS